MMGVSQSKLEPGLERREESSLARISHTLVWTENEGWARAGREGGEGERLPSRTFQPQWCA
jgi:hypothetical protein